MHETFLAVVRGSVRYEPRASVRTYLYAIALKLVWAERRRVMKQQSPAPAEPEPGNRSSPADAAIWVAEALAKLDPAERELLMLREFEQLTYSEIAELLRLPVNTVKPRLFRSRMALKGYLVPCK